MIRRKFSRRAEILRIKAAVRQRDGMRCTVCGMTNENHLAQHRQSLHVHRVVPGSLYTLSGCVSLCLADHAHAPRRKRKRGEKDLDNRAIHVLISQPIRDALDAYLEGEEAPTLTRAVETALKEFLAERGFWPLPSKQSVVTEYCI